MAQVRAPRIASRHVVVYCFIVGFTSLFLPLTLAQNFPGNQRSVTPGVSFSESASTPVFLPAVAYSSGAQTAMSVAAADFNQDGRQDLVVANFAGGIDVMFGNGDGTFQTAIAAGATGPSSVEVGDLNGDGKPDVVVVNLANLGGMVQVLVGNGDGTFQPAANYASGGAYPTSVTISDVNGDGKLDLIVTNEEGHVFGGLVGVLLGNGDGTFQPVVTYDSGGGDAWSVAVADVNGDRKPDLVVSNVCSKTSCSTHGVVTILLGNGDGTFQLAAAYDSGGFQAFSIAVGDVNGDGKPDIAAVNVGSDNVGVLLGNGDGTFQPALTYPTGGVLLNGSQSVALADVNGDGELDLIVANCAPEGAPDCSGLETGVVGILLGKGDGTFQSPVTYDSGGFEPWTVIAADMNSDGKPDLIVVNQMANQWPNLGPGSVGVLLNNTPFCTTAPTVAISATPNFLWPPNGRMVPVAFSGTITNTQTGCSIQNAAYAVKDEYNKVQPSGPLTLGPGGAFLFTVPLQASRLGSDLNGRQYTVTVGASDNAGMTGSQSETVIVPHDRGR